MYTVNNILSGRFGVSIVDLQGYIARVSPLFGLTVASVLVPVNPKSRIVNWDYIKKRIESLVHARKDMIVHGQGVEFMRLSNIAGVTFTTGGGTVPVPGPSGPVVSNITTTTALIDWNDLVISGVNDVRYNLQVIKASDGTFVKSYFNLVPSQQATTGLTAATAYKARVTAYWNGGSNYTDWSPYTNFSTI
jgi:hypothetical protein